MKPHGYKTINALRTAAQEIQGQPVVRAADAARILRRNGGTLRRMVLEGKLERITLQVPSTRSEPRGLRAYYVLAGLEALASRQASSRSRRPWNASELQLVQEMAGLHTIEDIASRLKRTTTAVWYAIHRLSQPAGNHQPEVAGGLYALVARQHRMIPGAELARLVDRDRSNIKWWVRKGCPSVRRPGRQRQHMFDLGQVRRWLAAPDQHGILVLMSQEVRRRLRLTADDLRQLYQESEVAA